MDFEKRFESIANRVLPPIRLETYESREYGSLNEIESDIQSEWDDYRNEKGLEDFSELDEIFEVKYNSGIFSSESLGVESADYLVKFEELGAEDGYEAGFYTTEHFGGRESRVVPNFFTEFLKENFEPVDILNE